MPTNEPDAMEVGYTVKELIARLEGKIDMLIKLVNEKVSHAEFEKLEDRLGKVEYRMDNRFHILETTYAKTDDFLEAKNRIAKLETSIATSAAVAENKRLLETHASRTRLLMIGLIIQGIGLLATVGTLLVRHL